MISRRIHSLCLCLVLMLSTLAFVIPSHAALCPGSSLSTICADFTEGGGAGITMQSTRVVISRDGAALPAVTIPASSAGGRQTQFTSMPTVACQSDTYTATAQSNYLVGATPFQGLIVSATPGAGLVKDRTGEPACVEAPSNFSMH